MRNFRILTLLGTALITLSACNTMDGLVKDMDTLELGSALSMNEDDPDNLTLDSGCPKVEVVPELKYYSDYADDGSTRPELLVSRVDIASTQTACHFDRRTVTVDLKTRFEGALGPKGRVSAKDKPFFSYPFFVAVAESGGKIMTKEIYAASITYPPGQDRQSYNENMRFILPMETRDHGANQKILIGFQLTPEQLEHNRQLLKEDMARRRDEREQRRRIKFFGSDPEPVKEIELKAPENIVIDSRPLEEQKMEKIQNDATKQFGR